MIKIYVVWQYDPILRKEVVFDWSRNKDQADLKQQTTTIYPSRVDEFLIDQTKLNKLRIAKKDAAQYMLDNIHETIKEIGADKDSAIILRRDLIDRVEEATGRINLPVGVALNDEITRYLDLLHVLSIT